MATTDENARRSSPADAAPSSKLMRWTENPFALLPTLTALGLAGLYAIGALLKTTQLMGADLTVRDTLPLVPLPQLLAAGIGTVMQSLVLVPVVAAMFASFRVLEKRRHARERRRGQISKEIEEARTAEAKLAAIQGAVRTLEASSRRIRLIAIGALVSSGAGACAVAIFMPWNAALTLAVFLIFLVAVAIKFDPRPMVMMGIYLCSFPIVVVVIAFIWPAPLPKAELALGIEKISGPLVAATDSVWYVKVADHTVRAAPLQDVRAPRFESIPTPQKPSLWDLMHDQD